MILHFLGKTYWQHLATNRRFDPHPRGFRFIWLYSGKGIQAHKFIFQWLGHHQSHAGFSGGTSCTPEMHSPRRCCPPPCYIKPLSFWKNQSSRGSIHFFLEFAFCVRIHCHFDRGQVKKQTVLLKFMLKPWIDQYLKPSVPIGSIEAKSSGSHWCPIPIGTGADFFFHFLAVIQSVAASDGHSTFKSVCPAALPARGGDAVEGGGGYWWNHFESEKGYDRKVPPEPHSSPNSQW